VGPGQRLVEGLASNFYVIEHTGGHSGCACVLWRWTLRRAVCLPGFPGTSAAFQHPATLQCCILLSHSCGPCAPHPTPWFTAPPLACPCFSRVRHVLVHTSLPADPHSLAVLWPQLQALSSTPTAPRRLPYQG
jgi:hypothetical protein